MGKCPYCKRDISYLNRTYRVIATDEVTWDGEGLVVETTDLEEEDGAVVLRCPLCGEDIGYSLDDAEEILGK